MTDNLSKQQQLFEKYLRFHEDLFKVHVKNMQRLIAVISFQKLNKIDVNAKIKKGDCIISPQDLMIEEKELENIFDEILPVIRKYCNNQKELNRLEDLSNKRKFSLKLLMKNVLVRKDEDWEKLATELNLSKKLLKKIGEYISAPYLELCSEYFNKKIQTPKWKHSICPICGSYPSMASVNEKLGYRVLWCRLCNTEWKFEQNVCPFCLTEDLKSLKHIFPPEKSPNRIDVCENCKKYLKIVDEQLVSKKPNFIVDYLATFHLDLLAIRNGYTNYESICNDRSQ